ncbi:MAG TPA: ABC transporter substrate-binding protein [Candidatus Binatia bacterium]|nr:ABC transporter substrate-binding protein [Candidatus Binatia bacterium]
MPHTRILPRFVVAALFLLALAAPRESAAQQLKKVTVVYTIVSGDSVAFWVAEEKGFFRKYGLDADLKFITGSNQTIASMMAGQVDFTNAGGGAVVEADLQGGDAVMIGSLVPYFLMSMYSQPEIQSVKDLKGKRIAVTTLGTATDFARRIIVQKAGLNPDRDTLPLSTKGPSEILQALLTKNAEAGMVVPPLTLMAKQKGLKELVDLIGQKVPYVQTSVTTTRRILQKDPAAAEGFMKAIVEAVAFQKQELRATKEILNKYLKNIPDDLLDETYQRYVVDMYQKYPRVSHEGLQTLLDFVKLTNEKAKAAKPEQFTDTSVLEKLEKTKFADQFYK